MPDTVLARYHRGDLPEVLRTSAADLLAERGPGGFSLREVARRAGVSHAAPAHHFGSIEGLLTAVAIEGFEHLRAAFVEAAELASDPIDRLRRQGRVYVEGAVAHPGHCAVMFRKDLVDGDDPQYSACGLAAYGELYTTIEQIRDAVNPELDVDVAARLCWAAMQGLVELYGTMREIADDTDRRIDPIGETAERFGDLLVAGLAPRST
jgi:AcrR family transcriptional regulator